MACDHSHSAGKTCFCINDDKVAAMMCRQDTVKVTSLPRLLWQSACWTDLLQSSTYRLTSQIAGFCKVAWSCWAISSSLSSTGLGTQRNRHPASQQSRGLSIVHLKSYLICQAPTTYCSITQWFTRIIQQTGQSNRMNSVVYLSIPATLPAATNWMHHPTRETQPVVVHIML